MASDTCNAVSVYNAKDKAWRTDCGHTLNREPLLYCPFCGRPQGKSEIDIKAAAKAEVLESRRKIDQLKHTIAELECQVAAREHRCKELAEHIRRIEEGIEMCAPGTGAPVPIEIAIHARQFIAKLAAATYNNQPTFEVLCNMARQLRAYAEGRAEPGPIFRGMEEHVAPCDRF